MSNDWQRNYVTLPTGERIRYSLFKRNGDYYVRFRTREGDRVKRSTGCGGKQKQAAAEEAHKIILGEYGAVSESLETVTWDAARTKLREGMEADGKRPKTIDGYLEVIDRLVDICPSYGPASITEAMAAEFKTKYGKGKYSRKRKVVPGEKVAQYDREISSVKGRVRTLKAIFGWLRSLRLIEKNPFANVSAPKVDRREIKYVSQGDVSEFFRWIDERYGSWSMPRLFFSVKAVTGCRLEDICCLRSDGLQDGRLTFHKTKNRTTRHARIPASLYAELQSYAGETYLWERYPPELIEANKAKGWPTHRQNREFSPKRLYLWVVQIIGVYQQESGHHLSSHDFRRAAVTRAAEKNIPVTEAAVMFDMTPQNALTYYAGVNKKLAADKLAALADDLLPLSPKKAVSPADRPAAAPAREPRENGPKMVPKQEEPTETK